ncbi:Hypothetical_protein [Hexamita inflata]|uniref:Hypothetical_protein n=1 Tax=Hexamita inflata TaxID=28002 RepID=A0AA86UVK9_9EUKA|nr:Hypothetical protein HINF_LOCUS54227 [Hexamita inflata]
MFSKPPQVLPNIFKKNKFGNGEISDIESALSYSSSYEECSNENKIQSQQRIQTQERWSESQEFQQIDNKYQLYIKIQGLNMQTSQYYKQLLNLLECFAVSEQNIHNLKQDLKRQMLELNMMFK